MTDLVGAAGSPIIEDPTFGKYSETAADFDRIAWENPYHTIVASAGNERRTVNEQEPGDASIYLNSVIQPGDIVFSPDGRQQTTITSMDAFLVDRQTEYDTLMGDQSVSKNALVVGAVWSAADGLQRVRPLVPQPLAGRRGLGRRLPVHGGPGRPHRHVLV